jgi:hypothetical protein
LKNLLHTHGLQTNWQVTFNSTVPQHCRDALVRFRNSGVIDFDDYVHMLQDSMPDEFERAKEINLVWDNMKVCLVGFFIRSSLLK